MSKLSLPDKTFLEAVLGMSGGYVLDFTNTSLAQLFDDLAIDIYEDKYAEYGVSKANRLRTLLKIGGRDLELRAEVTRRLIRCPERAPIHRRGRPRALHRSFFGGSRSHQVE